MARLAPGQRPYASLLRSKQTVESTSGVYRIAVSINIAPDWSKLFVGIPSIGLEDACE
jgi:hypothetical protein